jgi:transglutaminase-like putative cysteine protease
VPIAFPPQPYFREPLLSGDAGVAQTIHQMRLLVDEALRDPSIIRLATDIVRSVPAFDDLAEANALYEWVRHNIRFTKDPVNKEKLYPPSELLKIRAGDCDDISMLLGTLLMAVGYPARLMTVAAGGDEFSHVYVEANRSPTFPVSSLR